MRVCGAIAGDREHSALLLHRRVGRVLQHADHQATDPNNQWRGFGKGTCQAKNDQTRTSTSKYGKFTRVGLVNDGRTFAYTDPFTGDPGTRTYAEEMTNYSNWYTYYRTRILTAKTTTAIAFNNVDKTYRAGFHTMNLRSDGAP